MKKNRSFTVLQFTSVQMFHTHTDTDTGDGPRRTETDRLSHSVADIPTFRVLVTSDRLFRLVTSHY